MGIDDFNEGFLAQLVARRIPVCFTVFMELPEGYQFKSGGGHPSRCQLFYFYFSPCADSKSLKPERSSAPTSFSAGRNHDISKAFLLSSFFLRSTWLSKKKREEKGVCANVT